MRWQSEAGSSLIELIVGGAIALIVLGVIIQIQISGYRYQQNDSDRFTVQMEMATALDRLTRDVRMASGFAVAGGEITLTMSESTTVIYRRDGMSQEVIRIAEGGSQQVVGHMAERLSFFSEDGGKSVRVEWEARLPDGTTYLLISKASPRVHPGG